MPECQLFVTVCTSFSPELRVWVLPRRRVVLNAPVANVRSELEGKVGVVGVLPEMIGELGEDPILGGLDGLVLWEGEGVHRDESAPE